jgi:hypothetical protein
MYGRTGKTATSGKSDRETVPLKLSRLAAPRINTFLTVHVINITRLDHPWTLENNTNRTMGGESAASVQQTEAARGAILAFAISCGFGQKDRRKRARLGSLSMVQRLNDPPGRAGAR